MAELAAVFRLPSQVRSKTQATGVQLKADILAELIIRQKQNTSVVFQLLFFSYNEHCARAIHAVTTVQYFEFKITC